MVLERAFTSGNLKRIIVTAGSLSEAKQAILLCNTDGMSEK